VPKLQTVGLVCRFLRWQRKVPIPSSAAFGKIGEAYVRDIERYAKDNGIPLQHFKKGESKEAVARPLIDAAAKQGGPGKVVLIGVSQEVESQQVVYEGGELREDPPLATVTASTSRKQF
jgi:hypothetical protein